jgi:hypothetical protein
MTRDNGHRQGTRLAAPASDPGERDGGAPALDRSVQSRIGDNLRALYDDLVHQPVPDRFRELLARLDEGKDGRS